MCLCGLASPCAVGRDESITTSTIEQLQAASIASTKQRVTALRDPDQRSAPDFFNCLSAASCLSPTGRVKRK
jgi:hypothetical protein